jgi:hypothetical protein
METDPRLKKFNLGESKSNMGKLNFSSNNLSAARSKLNELRDKVHTMNKLVHIRLSSKERKSSKNRSVLGRTSELAKKASLRMSSHV